MAEYYKIGKLVASHGLTGELILKHSLGKKTALSNLKKIFIPDASKALIPWFVEKGTAKTADETLLKLEQVDTKEQAGKLVQKEAWMDEADFKQHVSQSAPIQLLGYLLIQDKKPLSEIVELIEQPHQLLCKIMMTGKEILIPLPPPFIKKIDHQRKEIHVELPEGLIEIYMS